MSKSLEIHVDRNGSSAVVQIKGIVDSETSPELLRRMLELFKQGGQDRVILDFKGVESIDSSGIASLVEGLYEAKTRNARLILSGLNEVTRERLALTLLTRVFEITRSVEEALG